MSYRQISDEIAEKISAIPDVGRVHPYQRYVRDMENFVDLFGDSASEDIRVWTTSRTGFGSIQSADHGVTRIHQFQIQGFMSLSDNRESELAFQELIDLVARQFDPPGDLNRSSECHYAIQGVSVGREKIGGHFLHTCTLRLEVQEYLTD